ncbi:MAG: hypothetical protein HGA47_01815, partial [Zoogloea sp.]|nr:hypothetical protein [Zoogloea sp.]
MKVDIQTAYLAAGLLYVVCPLTVWMVLRGHRSLSVRLWCAGGILAGVGAFLVGLRGSISPDLSYVAANALLFLGILLRQASLSRELGRRLLPALYVCGWAAFMAAYVVVLQCTEGDRWRLLLVFAANGVVTAMNAQRARQLAQAR